MTEVNKLKQRGILLPGNDTTKPYIFAPSVQAPVQSVVQSLLEELKTLSQQEQDQIEEAQLESLGVKMHEPCEGILYCGRTLKGESTSQSEGSPIEVQALGSVPEGSCSTTINTSNCSKPKSPAPTVKSVPYHRQPMKCFNETGSQCRYPMECPFNFKNELNALREYSPDPIARTDSNTS